MARLTDVVHGIQARFSGEAMTWSPTLDHCVGGMFAVLPTPADMTDAKLMYEQQVVGSTAD